MARVSDLFDGISTINQTFYNTYKTESLLIKNLTPEVGETEVRL